MGIVLTAYIIITLKGRLCSYDLLHPHPLHTEHNANHYPSVWHQMQMTTKITVTVMLVGSHCTLS